MAAVGFVDLEEARPAFERIARLTQAIAKTPVACVAFVEADRLWLAGVQDVDPGVVSREHAFADWVIRDSEVLWIEDATKDARVAHYPLVTGAPHYRFYAGAPICLSTGDRVGSMTVIGHAPRAYDAVLAGQLKDLAALVADEWERRRAVKIMAQSEADALAANTILSEMIESAPAALLMTDREMRILNTSRVWRRDMGLSGDPGGQCIYDLFPGSRARWSEQYERCLAGEVIRGRRVQLSLPGGAKPWVRVHMTPWRDGEGKIGGLLIMTQDVTDMVESLQKVERSERRLKMATELAKLTVWEFDMPRAEISLEGIGAKSNAAPFDVAVEAIWNYVHPDDRDMARAAWQSHLDHGTPYRLVYRGVRPDGSTYWAQATSEAIRDANGEVERIVGVSRNIDEERRAEATIEKALHEAEAANRAKSEFLANMSHEIRTPLNGVLGVADALAKTALAGEQREMVATIERSAQTLSRLLADVLDLARIESGRFTLKDEAFNLAELLRGAAGLFEPEAQGKGLALDLRLGAGVDNLVRGDSTRLRQLISNLLSNAVKFTEAGGVALSARVKLDGDLMKLKLAVSDTGIGFDAATAQRLFGRFEQADGSPTRRAGGAGLGLALARSLAEAMGGTLTATSRPGAGSTFTLDIAFRIAEATSQTETSPQQASPPPGLRVLLAEDHPTNRKVVELILGSVGVNLICVENGLLAVEAVQVGAFDLVLMDMQMPVMDGLTAIREIRKREAESAAPRLPIICLTANAMPEHIDASRAAGADLHLTKPISAARLIEAVRQAAEYVSRDAPTARSA